MGDHGGKSDKIRTFINPELKRETGVCLYMQDLNSKRFQTDSG